MSDLISRQAAIDAFYKHPNIHWTTLDVLAEIKALPSAQPDLYGYKIEHLALIARVMQKEGVSPEDAVRAFNDIQRICEMVIDEVTEIIQRETKVWT